MTSSCTDSAVELSNVMDMLLREARAEPSFRHQDRIPFFRPISVSTLDLEAETIETFGRDISPEGIGLVHTKFLRPSDYFVSIPVSEGDPVRMHLDIRWCRPNGKGWYTSGGRFLRLASR